MERTESKELNFTKARLDAVKGRVPMIIRDGDHYKLKMGKPEVWPEEPVTYSLEEDDFERFQNQLGEPLPKQAGQKLADLLEEKPPWDVKAEAEKVFADMQILGVGFTLNGKHVPYSEVTRDPDDDIEVNGS